MQGHPYGSHRVLQPAGVLPQPAWKLDHTAQIYSNEILVEVEALNIDSASFHQLKQEAQGNQEEIKRLIMNIVQERGKMHNPVTGSGGMLIGTISEIGPAYPHQDIRVGDRIASLVSLTLTPLHIEQIEEVSMETSQIKVKAKAILFASSPLAKIPNDIPEPISLALLDVCGAPAQVDRFVQEGHVVFVLGAGGKSGLLSTYQAKKKAGRTGKVIAVEYDQGNVEALADLNIADMVWQGDATDALSLYERIHSETKGKLADIVINCVNVPHTEMTSILSTKQGGTAYFFSMATSFTAAALGAEGAGKDISLMIGNGYAQGHAEFTLNLFRESAILREYFHQKFRLKTPQEP